MNHSRSLKKIVKIVPLSILLFLSAGFFTSLRAQMFTVEGEPGTIDIPGTAIYAGVEPADFDFRGTTGGRFEFSGPLLRLRLETPTLDIFFATGGSMTGIEGISFLDVGLSAGYGFKVLNREKVILILPVRIKSGLTSAVSDQTIGSASQFNQGSLTAGGGFLLALRPSPRVRIHTGFMPYYGFSFATGGTFGGSKGSLEGKLRLFLDGALGDMGLSLGYGYSYDRFDIETNTFDYDLKTHSILVGITF